MADAKPRSKFGQRFRESFTPAFLQGQQNAGALFRELERDDFATERKELLNLQIQKARKEMAATPEAGPVESIALSEDAFKLAPHLKKLGLKEGDKMDLSEFRQQQGLARKTELDRQMMILRRNRDIMMEAQKRVSQGFTGKFLAPEDFSEAVLTQAQLVAGERGIDLGLDLELATPIPEKAPRQPTGAAGGGKKAISKEEFNALKASGHTDSEILENFTVK